ncbi:hypothetical protein CEXT_141511 [Caerostris extrusa]|uniref:Uncharacterized protein n=1 Tax=Caerostris extrusa TaxID=172846 RepID=A0AAV4XUZ4_CAEEX|nr:hypothetical protein CEXT_141511 [Caerostris extrusa]
MSPGHPKSRPRNALINEMKSSGKRAKDLMRWHNILGIILLTAFQCAVFRRDTDRSFLKQRIGEKSGDPL